MATFRNQGVSSFSVGSPPPQVTWTIVRGDTAAFQVYVTDQDRNPLYIPDWEIEMDIVRPETGDVIVELFPAPTIDDGPGQFTVSLTAAESDLLETKDVFDIQMSSGNRIWTIAQGSMIVIEDITR